MLKTKHRLALLAGGAIAAASMPASATTLVRMDFQELVAAAEVVVVGEATASRTEETAEGVRTITTFEVDSAVVGAPGGTVEVATPGGSIQSGRFKLRIADAGAPLYILGSEALLMLDANAGDAYSVVGYSQGSFAVFDTPRGESVKLPDNENPETVAEAADRIRAEKESPNAGRGREKVAD